MKREFQHAFAHLASVPNTAPDWPGTCTMLLIAAALTSVGALGYRHRDLRG